MKDTFVVIAAFNEAKSIEDVVNELKDNKFPNVIVVDDGSSDNTGSIAEEAGATVLTHCINRGQGAALKTGIDFAIMNNADIIVTYDADGQHCVKDLPGIIAPVKEGVADIALGSRFLRRETQETVPLIRKIFLKGGTFIVWAMYGMKLSDSHNGLRAISRDAAMRMRLRTNRMEHASEILDEIKRRNLKYCEVPVTIKYTEYSKARGQGTLNAFRILSKMVIQKLMK